MERTAGLKTGCGKDIMLSPDQMVPVHCTWLATSPSRSAAANISSHKPAGCPAIAARISRSLGSLPVTVTGFSSLRAADAASWREWTRAHEGSEAVLSGLP